MVALHVQDWAVSVPEDFMESTSKRSSSTTSLKRSFRSSLSDDHFVSSGKEFLSTRNYFDDAGVSTRSSLPADYESAEEDVFDIPPKHRSVAALQRWKRATLVLNATRRFRYTGGISIKEESPVHREERLVRLRRFRASAHAIRAANRFQKSLFLDGEPSQEFGVTPKTLAELVQDKQPGALQELGGVEGVALLVGSSLEKGVSDDPREIEKRRKVFGSNTYPRQSPKGFFAFLWDACKDPTLIILMVCAALSLIFGIKSHGIREGWYDGTSIGFAVFLVILVTSISDYRQALQFLALNEEKKNILVQVIRGGRRIEISIFDVVVGDIVSLNIGDQVPADGLFVAGHSLALDESSMTGESEPVHVNPKNPYLLSGSKVDDGQGLMVVTGVGMLTEWGQLMAEIGEDIGEETPLQVRLNGVATLVGQVGLSVALLVLVILLIFYFVGHKEGSNNSGKFKSGQTSVSVAMDSVVDILAIAVTIVVVAVPEGLPLAVTLTLAFAMKKMMADRALVRRLSACETMGSATTICSDKTGTLTLNQMTVVKAWVAGEMRDPGTELHSLEKDVQNLLLEGISQNSSGTVFEPADGGEPEVAGSPTEKAVLLWGLKMGMKYKSVKSQSTILQVETFNSIKKRAGVAVRVAESEKVHVHWKGAAEIVLDASNKILSADNSTLLITEDMRLHLRNVIEGMAAKSLRCIAFGYQELDISEVPTGEQLEVWKIPEEALTLFAIVGIKDPCRPEVHEAVKRCQRAGIMVRMVTGDNIVTAKAIAIECGILMPGGIAIEGAEFRDYSEEFRKEQLPKIVVMARSSPSDKLLMVRTLRELGQIVAVTGDGTNDAPALHEADIGLAMGISGTEVAKESSDIIILDDNFATVVKVVRWGRSIYLNIQKFIQFQLTVNVAALTINFVAAVSSGNVPLTAVQLLWVNLIMDTLGALALATEPPTDELLLRPPVGRRESLISNVMWRNILFQALYQIVVLLTLQFKGKDLMNLKGSDADKINNTVIFNAFVLCQLFNEVNARKPENKNIFRGLFRNGLFLSIISSTLILQVIIVEFLNKFASTVKLSWQHWLICIIIGCLSWPIAFIVKFIPVPKEPILNLNLKLLPWKPCKSSNDSKGAQDGGGLDEEAGNNEAHGT